MKKCIGEYNKRNPLCNDCPVIEDCKRAKEEKKKKKDKEEKRSKRRVKSSRVYEELFSLYNPMKGDMIWRKS